MYENLAEAIKLTEPNAKEIIRRSLAARFSHISSSLLDQEIHGDYRSTKSIDINYYESTIDEYNTLIRVYRALFPDSLGSLGINPIFTERTSLRAK